jgi:hypothetical protein
MVIFYEIIMYMTPISIYDYEYTIFNVKINKKKLLRFISIFIMMINHF